MSLNTTKVSSTTIYRIQYFCTANEKLEDHDERLRKLENKDKFSSIGGEGMDGDQIEQILKAIDDSQKELMDKVNEQLTGYAPLEKLNQVLDDLDALSRRVLNLENVNKLLNEKVEDNGEKIDLTNKTVSRNTNDINKLKMALKQGMKTMQSQQSFGGEISSINFDEDSDDAGVSSGALQDVIGQVQRLEKTFMKRVTELEKSSSTMVTMQKSISKLEDNMIRALAPRGPTISEEDVTKWNQNLITTKEL